MSTAAIVSLIVTYGPWVISGAAAAAAVLPKAAPGTPWAAIRGVIDALAVNFGNAKNAP